jgi:hypothetical protein
VCEVVRIRRPKINRGRGESNVANPERDPARPRSSSSRLESNAAGFSAVRCDTIATRRPLGAPWRHKFRPATSSERSATAIFTEHSAEGSRVRDVRIWWGLFVFFAALSVLVVQRRYQRWRGARLLAAQVETPMRAEIERRLRLEGWRLVLMAVSILAMGGIVVTVFWPGPATVLEVLRVIALLAVVGVLLLSLRL